jgi:glycosyltransferase involved in cell wall biosynthesis
MKLLLYAHDWAPTFGGIQTVTQILARDLSGQSDSHAEVTLVTMTPAGAMDDSALNYRVVRRPSLARLFALIRQADVIHIAGPCIAPLGISLLLKKLVVVEHHGFQAVCPNGQLLYQSQQVGCSPCPSHFMAGRHWECLRCNSGEGWLWSLRLWLLAFLRRGLSKCASANIVPTNYLGGMLGLPRTREIPHGLPRAPNRMSFQPFPGSRNGDGVPTFLFVGRLVTAKGAELLLGAAARLRTMGLVFRVHFVGDGPERAALEARARAAGLGPCAIFSGAINDAELERAWEDSIALVAPSLAGEVFGLVVADAMLRSKPVIVPAGGALAEVAGGAAFTFPIGDDAGLADCMKQCIEQPADVPLRGTNGRRRAELLFGETAMVREHLRLYAELAKAAGPAR